MALHLEDSTAVVVKEALGYVVRSVESGLPRGVSLKGEKWDKRNLLGLGGVPRTYNEFGDYFGPPRIDPGMWVRLGKVFIEGKKVAIEVGIGKKLGTFLAECVLENERGKWRLFKTDEIKVGTLSRKLEKSEKATVDKKVSHFTEKKMHFIPRNLRLLREEDGGSVEILQFVMVKAGKTDWIYNWMTKEEMSVEKEEYGEDEDSTVWETALEEETRDRRAGRGGKESELGKMVTQAGRTWGEAMGVEDPPLWTAYRDPRAVSDGEDDEEEVFDDPMTHGGEAGSGTPKRVPGLGLTSRRRLETAGSAGELGGSLSPEARPVQSSDGLHPRARDVPEGEDRGGGRQAWGRLSEGCAAGVGSDGTGLGGVAGEGGAGGSQDGGDRGSGGKGDTGEGVGWPSGRENWSRGGGS